MKKFKILLSLTFAMLFILSFQKVRATDILPDDAGYVYSSELKQLRTGTAPFDSDDNPGDDSSATNDIVRSFDQITWTIENTMSISDGADKYTGGRLYFEVTVPEGFTSETFKWDLDAMNWIEEPTLSEDKMTLSGYYSMKTTDTTVPGKQNLIFNGKVLGAKNGSKISPIFKIWLNGNTPDEYCTSQYNTITVSSAPSYNVKLTRNTNCQNRTTVELDGKQVSGRMFSYVTIFQLYNSSESKGMKGIEYPTGDFGVDIDMTLYKKVGNENVDISDKIKPVLWQYYVAGKGNNDSAGMIPGRSIYKGNNSFVYNGINITPEGFLTKNRDNCIYDSGTPNMVQDGNIAHLSISDYKFDGTFPRVTRDGNKDTATVYPDNVGCFSSIFFQIFVPDFEDYDEKGTYYLYVNDSNMNATSLSQIEAKDQKVENDDTTNAQYLQYKNGSYSDYLFIYKRNDNNFSAGNAASSWGAGDARIYRGQKVSLCAQFVQNSANDEENYPHTVNNFLKFDGDCYLPIRATNGKTFDYYTKNMPYKIWYTTKKDGTNWSSAKEMNEAEVTDMNLYENLEDVPKDDIITGVWMESTGGVIDSSSIYIPCVVKDTANINQTYAETQITTYWTDELDRSVYTITNPDVVWPKGVYYSKNNYIKSEFDDAGALITGTHYNGLTWGNTAQVIGAEQSISINPINPDTGEEKINYDMSKNEYDVTYKMEPVIKNPINLSLGETDVTVNVKAILPAQMSYVAGSSNYGDPEISKNTDGTTTLIWTIYNCVVNKTIEPVTFKGHINEESTNGQQLTVNCEVDADTSKIGTTRYKARIANTTVQVIDLAAHRLYKTVATPVIEQNGMIKYSISYKNNTDQKITDFQLLDILPYNGDSRGTDFNGSIVIDKLVLTQKDENGNVLSSNDNLTLKYTQDESARNATAKDTNLGDGWTVATSENIKKSISAFECSGTVGSQGLVTIEIYIQTNGNKPLDKYVNSGSTQVYAGTNAIYTSDVLSQVVSRSIEGTVWYDLNNDGLMDENEPKASNIKMVLVDADGNAPTDVNGNIVNDVKTDENGYYCFKNLSANNYYVVATMPDNTYSVTLKNVGSKSTINSKFNQDNKSTDLITKLNSLLLPNLIVSNENLGLVKKPTNVIVNYKEVGSENVLADQEEYTGRADDDYSTVNKLDEINEKNDNKYNFVKVDGQTQGKMQPDTLYITYWYQKKATNIKVRHIDIDTNEEIYDEKTIYGNIDQQYTTNDELEAINNKYGNVYEYVKVEGEKDGLMTSDPKTITYYYQKKNGEIEVNYLEYNTNKVLAQQVTSTGKIDTNYTTKDKLEEINNNSNVKYELVKIEGDIAGTYKLDKQVINYYYDKKGAKVITKYVDYDTNEEIYDEDINKGEVGQEYTTTNQLDNINKKYNNEYKFVKVTDNASGKMQEDTIYVTYYYSKNSSEIITDPNNKEENGKNNEEKDNKQNRNENETDNIDTSDINIPLLLAILLISIYGLNKVTLRKKANK